MKKYSVIYADPPWKYRATSNARSPEAHYPTMRTQDICAIPVPEIADEDCALFIWATMPKLKDAFAVIEAWGFKFKTAAFVWIKLNPNSDRLFWGMGAWTRSNAELCLFATKGQPQRKSTSVHQVIISHLEEHSKKPEEARRRIEALMGAVPKIELFARRTSPGWDVWGNEVSCDVLL